MRPITLLLLLVVIVVGVVVVTQFTGNDAPQKTQQTDDERSRQDAPRLEEKYGFTGETVDP